MSDSAQWLITSVVAAVVLDSLFIWAWRRFNSWHKTSLVSHTSGQRKMALPSISDLTTILYGFPARLMEPVIARIRGIPIVVAALLVFALAYASQFVFDNTTTASSTWGTILFLAVFPATWLLAYRDAQAAELKATEQADTALLPAQPVSAEALKKQPWRTFLITLAGMAIMASTSQARILEANLPAALLWLVAVSLFIIGCWPDRKMPRVAVWKEALQGHWGEIVLAASIIAASTFLRFYRLDLPEVGMEQDAAMFGVDALKFLSGDKLYLFSTGWFFDIPAVYTILQAGIMSLFGKDPFGLGLLSAVQGSINIVLVYLLARRLFGPRAAALAAVLLAVSPYHLYYSRTGENNLVVPLFLTATIYFLHRAMYTRHAWDYAMSGASFGMGLWWDYNNKSTQLLPIMGGILLFLLIKHWRFWRVEYPRLGILIAAAVLVLLPSWSARAETNHLWADASHGKFILFNLARGAERYGTDNPVLIVAHQVEYALFGINHIGSGGKWPTGRPMMDSLTAVFFFIGLAYTVWRWKDTRYGTLLLWWGIGLQASVWSTDPPYAHRLVLIVVPSYVIAAIGLYTIGLAWSKSLNWNRRIYAAIIAALLLGNISYTNLKIYFSPENYPLDWLETAQTGKTVKELVDDYEVYYLGFPRYYAGGHGTILFFSQLTSLKTKEPFEHVSTFLPLREPVTRDVAFVFHSGRINEFLYVRACYPNGVIKDWYSEQMKLIYLRVYIVPKDKINRLISTGNLAPCLPPP